MGKNLKLNIDRSQDRAYPAGSRVMFIQHALTRLGIVSFQAQAPLYDYHGGLANKAYRKSFKLHDKVLRLPVEQPSNFRTLDEKLLPQIYTTGSELVMNTYLMFEHLSRYMLGSHYLPGNEDMYYSLEDRELKEKLKHITEIIGKPELLQHKGYGILFSDWEKMRHAINHPKFSNIYSADKADWDNVPIAWMVSGKHLDAFSDITFFFGELLSGWKVLERPNKPGTLTNIEPVISGVHTQAKLK